MNTDNGHVSGSEEFKPKLPRLREWRLSRAPVPPMLVKTAKAPRTGLLISGALMLVVILAGGALVVNQPDVADHIAAMPVAAERVADKSRNVSSPAYPPIDLPSGLAIDRSSVLNYDLAVWLATAPTSPRTFVFDRVRFAPGSAAIGDADQPTLQALSQILTAYPRAKATITGNGPSALGSERATAIRDALLQLAADPAQLRAASGDGSENAPKLTVKLDLDVASDLDA